MRKPNPEKAEETRKLHEWFQEMWDRLPKKKYCRNCGTPIWGECLSIYWDHLLEKNFYPQYRFEEWNIYFCCGNCHSNKSSGFPGEDHQLAIDRAMGIHKNLIRIINK